MVANETMWLFMNEEQSKQTGTRYGARPVSERARRAAVRTEASESQEVPWHRHRRTNDYLCLVSHMCAVRRASAASRALYSRTCCASLRRPYAATPNGFRFRRTCDGPHSVSGRCCRAAMANTLMRFAEPAQMYNQVCSLFSSLPESMRIPYNPSEVPNQNRNRNRNRKAGLSQPKLNHKF